jgi:hypothetical protein
MNITVSPQLQSFVSEVKQKRKVTLKEILMLQSLISSERKWMNIVDYFMDFLFVLGVTMFIQIPRKILGFEDSILFCLLTTGSFYGASKLFWNFVQYRNLYRNLKSIGINCPEIETLSMNLSLIVLKHSASNFLRISNFLFSTKTQKEVFEPIVTDWQEEYFDALFKKEIWKARWINVRYTYAFLIAMWQKSPIGDLIEFISKIAK